MHGTLTAKLFNACVLKILALGRNPVSKRSEKFKAKKSEKNENISLRFVSLRSENYSSEAKRKI